MHDPEDARIRHRQIPALTAAGMYVTYAAPFRAFGRTPPPGVRGIDLPRARGRRRLRAVLRARSMIRRVGKSADIIILHDPDLLVAAAGLGNKDGRIVWDVHEDTAAAIGMREWVPPVLRRPLRWLIQMAEHLAEKRFSLLLAEHSYAERFRRPHPVIPNSNWVPESPPEPPGDTRVVYLGSITTPRGGREMIEVARAAPELQVTLIGPADATMEPELEAAHASGVLTWLGFVPNDEATQMLDGALAGLALLHDQPNYAHSLPTKIAEYLAHGVPVITTPNHSSAELVQASGGGFVVGFGDVEATVAALRDLARDEEQRRALAESGYRYVEANVNWHHDAAEFVETIRNLAFTRPH
ncbi:glycosyltransferase family protein [Ruania rhizosphaerae]|uniref:glycosyltransferase family protein n=1 Tax=Ruania rhizosphaerae TaxID=1840413 RepID=UPI001358C883|nr:glycosyltransferase [Ruania rhizosphaerae]